MPSVAIVRPYEAIYIVDPDLGEEQVNTIAGRYKSLVETNGGTVEKIDVWERRRLAYEIKGRTEGIYVIMHFSGTAPVEAELRRIFLISEDQIRAMIVKREDTDDAAAPAPAAVAAPAMTPAPMTEAVAPEVPATEVPAIDASLAPAENGPAETTEPEIHHVATEAETPTEDEATSAAPAA